MSELTKLQCEECFERRNSCFRMLSSEDLNWLCREKKVVHYKKGQYVFHNGMTPTGVFCLKSGKIKIAKSGNDGKDQILRFVLPGNLLGIRSFLSKSAYSASAVTLENCEICYIPKSVFSSIQNRYQDLACCMITTLSRLLMEAEEKLISIAQNPVRVRLAEALLSLRSIFKEYPLEDQADVICMSREDLANIVGTATETVIRLLSTLKSEGVIALKGRKIFILKPDELKRMAMG